MKSTQMNNLLQISNAQLNLLHITTVKPESIQSKLQTPAPGTNATPNKFEYQIQLIKESNYLIFDPTNTTENNCTVPSLDIVETFTESIQAKPCKKPHSG